MISLSWWVLSFTFFVILGIYINLLSIPLSFSGCENYWYPAFLYHKDSIKWWDFWELVSGRQWMGATNFQLFLRIYSERFFLTILELSETILRFVVGFKKTDAFSFIRSHHGSSPPAPSSFINSYPAKTFLFLLFLFPNIIQPFINFCVQQKHLSFFWGGSYCSFQYKSSNIFSSIPTKGEENINMI